MKKTLALLAAVTALSAFALASPGPQAPAPANKPDIVGTWVGYAVAPGMRFELTAVFDKGPSGYAGKLSDASGALADTPLREIVFKDGKLSFDFDLVLGADAMLIRIELVLENEVLKGSWFNAEGSSDVVELALKK